MALLVDLAQTVGNQCESFYVFTKVLPGDATAAAACSSSCRENPLLEFPVGDTQREMKKVETGWLSLIALKCSLQNLKIYVKKLPSNKQWGTKSSTFWGLILKQLFASVRADIWLVCYLT